MLSPEVKASREDLNILILGETGVGKSTWINSIANYLKFSSLDHAAQNYASEMMVLISSKFKVMDTLGHEHGQVDVKVGDPDNNEVQVPGKSATQYPKAYPFTVNNMTINLIDTPGIGDTEGIEVDKQNFENILTFLSHYDNIHGVCILLKPNESRLNVHFRFCLLELLTHLHRSLVQNIMFCFTHTRSTFYTPGDTFDNLRQLLRNNEIDLKLIKEKTYFCFDNESFRLLACLNNGVQIEERNKKAYSDSWNIASDMTHKMIEHIKTLPPHSIRNTISVNEARTIVSSLSEPMTDIVQLIQNTNEESEEVKGRIEHAKNDIREVEQNLRFKGFSMKITSLKLPQTVCAHPSCVDEVQIGHGKVKETIYPMVCHKNCTIGSSFSGNENKNLKRCRAFYTIGMACRKCNHSHTSHKHLTYKKEIIEQQFFSKEVENKIREKGSEKEKKEEFLIQLQTKTKELENEQRFLIQSAAKFSTFMKHKAMLPYNDSFNEYLDMMIANEEKKPEHNKDHKKIEKLKHHKTKYNKEIELLKNALSDNAMMMINASDIFEIRAKLVTLKHFGPHLKELLGKCSTNIFSVKL